MRNTLWGCVDIVCYGWVMLSNWCSGLAKIGNHGLRFKKCSYVRYMFFGFFNVISLWEGLKEVKVKLLFSRFFIDFSTFQFLFRFLVVIASIEISLSIVFLSVLSFDSLDMSFTAWRVMPARLTMLLSNYDNCSLHSAVLSDAWNMVNSYSNAFLSVRTVSLLPLGIDVAMALPIQPQDSRVTSLQVLFLLGQAHFSIPTWSCGSLELLL